MNYFNTLEKILLKSNPENKVTMFQEFYKLFLNNKLKFEDNYKPIILEKPSYYDFLEIKKPTNLPPIKNFNTLEGKKYLIHTILHIEYSAIDLALDAALRYQNMPLNYYKDWLEVADDEIRHFLMLKKLLNELGGKYGDYPVHKNLFEALQQTPSFLKRMAVVPRYLEANGLDQNPKIMEKLNSNKDNINSKLIKILEIILDEEVEHVRKGDFWFKEECKKLNLEPESTYLDIIKEIFPNSLSRNMDLNFNARLKAGFSKKELEKLSKN